MTEDHAMNLHTLHPGIDTEAHYRLSDGYHVRPLHIRKYGRGEQVVYVRTHQPDVQRRMGLQDWLCAAKPWPKNNTDLITQDAKA